MSTTTIYWIRHGEAEGNLYRRCQGHYNSLITPNGKAQLGALRSRFEDTHLDAIYSSDLYRAFATANILAAPRNLTVTTHPGLREIFMGPWEDRTWVEVNRGWPAEDEVFSNTIWDFYINGGETMLQARNRAVSALKAIAARHPNQTIALTSHGAVTRAVMAHLQGLADTQMNNLFHGDNTSVSKLVCRDGVFEVVYYADNSHLGTLSTLAQQSWWRQAAGKDPGFWFKPVDFDTQGQYVEAFRRDAWHVIYGNWDYYNGAAFLQEARIMGRQHPSAVVFAMEEDRPVGLLQMDFSSPFLKEGIHISFFYLIPEYRQKGLGVQIIGQAVSTAREQGRSEVGLRVFDGNAHALHFYQKYGFKQVGTEPSFQGKLLQLALDIRVPALSPSSPWR